MDNSVTVLMGIYNCADTLPEALGSLLAQTYTGWKCILCDDGSTDDTYSVAEKYQNDYPNKFVLIKNDTNLGLNVTLNKCLKYADTPFIARMDGDDKSEKTRFEKELNFLLEHPEYDIVSSAISWFDEQGIYKTSNTGVEIPTLRDVIVKHPIYHAPSMMRTSKLNEIGGYSEDESRLRVEDVDLWIRMFQNGAICYNLNEALYLVRESRNQSKRVCISFRKNEAKLRLEAANKENLGIRDKISCVSIMIIGLLPKHIYMLLHKINK